MDLLGLAAEAIGAGHGRSGRRARHRDVQLVQAYQERDADRDRELADLRTQLARAQAPGRPPLTVLAGKAEQP